MSGFWVFLVSLDGRTQYLLGSERGTYEMVARQVQMMMKLDVSTSNVTSTQAKSRRHEQHNMITATWIILSLIWISFRSSSKLMHRSEHYMLSLPGRYFCISFPEGPFAYEVLNLCLPHIRNAFSISASAREVNSRVSGRSLFHHTVLTLRPPLSAEEKQQERNRPHSKRKKTEHTKSPLRPEVGDVL